MPSTRTAADVFTIHEVARAACVPDSAIRAAIDAGEGQLIRGRFIAFEDAARLARGFRTGATDASRPRDLFAPAPVDASRKGVPLAASGALHAGLLAAMVLIAGLGARGAPTEQRMLESARLVFLSTPGPGGGGGGGGLRQPRPAPKAKIRGSKSLESPVTVTRKVESREPEKRVEVAPPAVPEPKPDPPPPAPQPQPTPPVTAPVVSVPSATEDRAGVVKDGEGAPSHGPGTGGGTGTGTGTGSGEGNGAGIGDGSIAGIGGGPYRPGAGITPPSLLREVKPVYTEDGRRRGIEGEVEMEVVVRSDGTVGTVNITRGLGAGLDQRALDAVRQWRFTPARRHGKPVDVLVEVAVEFRLR